MSDLAKAVAKDAILKLESLVEYVKTSAKQAVEIVERAKQELSAAEEATRIGSSETFLGASVMLVGLSEYPIGDGPGYSQSGGRDVALQIDGNQHHIRLHGDPEALKNMRGRYKVIVLLFKAD